MDGVRPAVRNRYLLCSSVFPRQPLPRAWYDAGIAVKAGTIAGLASKVGLPELPATVQRFNLLAAAGGVRADGLARRGPRPAARHRRSPISPGPPRAARSRA
jgi:hypothetical protein